MSHLSERLQDSISIGQMCDDLRIARRSLERKFRSFTVARHGKCFVDYV